MIKNEALNELEGCIEEYHIDLSKYKLVSSEVHINPYFKTNKTLYVTYESKTTGKRIQANIEYYSDKDYCGLYNINI